MFLEIMNNFVHLFNSFALCFLGSTVTSRGPVRGLPAVAFKLAATGLVHDGFILPVALHSYGQVHELEAYPRAMRVQTHCGNGAGRLPPGPSMSEGTWP